VVEPGSKYTPDRRTLAMSMAIKPQNVKNISLLDCDFCHSELQPEKYAEVGVNDHAESL
jgi:hypothetical protein